MRSSLGLSVESYYSDIFRIESVGTEPSDDLSTEDLGDSCIEVQDLNDLPRVELKVASLLLKLENNDLVCSLAID